MIARLLEDVLAAWARAERAVPTWLQSLSTLAADRGIEDVAAWWRAALEDGEIATELIAVISQLAVAARAGAAPDHPAVRALRDALDALSRACIDVAMGDRRQTEEIEQLARTALDALSRRLVDAAMPPSRRTG